MIKKITLKDLTKEQYTKWYEENCNGECKNCIFSKVNCEDGSSNCWVYNKKLYSDAFLSQEIEIEVELPKLSDIERIILSNVSDDNCQYIVRDPNGKLLLHSKKPIKINGHWWPAENGYQLGFPFDKLFKFISVNDKPYKIKDLLKEN